MGYWEQRYRQEGMIWGSEASPTAYHAFDLFQDYHDVRTILVPGSGYGRNTKVFSSRYQVAGLELSQDAIHMAREWDQNSTFFQGSILNELEANKKYDAVYCFDVLHLFLQRDRMTLIHNCAKALNCQGLMYFTCFSDEDGNYGIGRQLEEGTYEYKADKYAHFFSEEDLRGHFREYEILETGSTIETLHYRDNQTREYALRYIIVKK